MASLRPFVFAKATVGQLLNEAHKVRADWAECITGFWGDAAAAKRERAMCEFMFLSNPSYQKVSIGALFHSVAISEHTPDAFCLHRHSKIRFIVFDYSVMRLTFCSLLWPTKESKRLQSKISILFCLVSFWQTSFKPLFYQTARLTTHH